MGIVFGNLEGIIEQEERLTEINTVSAFPSDYVQGVCILECKFWKSESCSRHTAATWESYLTSLNITFVTWKMEMRVQEIVQRECTYIACGYSGLNFGLDP